MATDAQINANRRNAAKSTGPKTEKGKAKARLNALKHGLRGPEPPSSCLSCPTRTPGSSRSKSRSGSTTGQPRNAIESELVRRGARLSWMLERGERFEAAHLAHRVRLAGRGAEGDRLAPSG